MNTCFAKIRRLAVPGVLLLVAVGAAACTSGSSPSSSPSSAPPTSSSSASASPSDGKAMAAKYPGCVTHMKDGANAKTTKMTNLRGVRYGEVSLLCGQSGASMYNTTGLNNKANPNDSAPADLWGSFSQEPLRKTTRCRTASRTAPVSGSTTGLTCP